MQKKVIIYSTPTCAYCRMAKDYFQKHAIEYTEHNIAFDIEKQKEMIDKSQQRGVPVIDIGGEIVLGFDKPRIDQLLGLGS